MRTATIGAAALLLAAAGTAPVDAAAIKTGRWQFTTQLQAGAAAQPAGAQASYSSCIKSDNAVPAELGPQCRLDHSEKRGDRFTWSMTCTNSQSKVRSEGVAQYHGDTMEATMVSHLPGPDGKETHMTQRITGHYVGPCLQASDMPMTPSHPTAPAAAQEAKSKTSADAAGKENSADTTASAEEKPPAAEDETATAPERRPPHRREARRHHSRRRHYAGSGGAYGGSAPYYSGFGPSPYSNNGP